jgi:hypothetical protein
MVFVPKTLGDLKQSLADRHNSGVLPTASATLAFWTRLFNKGQAYCADKLQLEKTTTLTTSSGLIALPDDFMTVISVYYSGTTNELGQVYQSDVAEQVVGTYWITGNRTDGFKLNAKEDKAFDVKYTFKPAEMTTDADKCIIPDPEAVVAYAYSFLRKSETDPIGDADKALQECDSRLTEILSQDNTNNNFSSFTFNA